MWHLIVNKDKDKSFSEKGFTLMELLIVIILIGILSAIAAPSFFSWLVRARVNDATSMVKGAISESQQEAIRKSKSCLITFPPSDTVEPTIEGTCLVLGERILDKVKIRHNREIVLPDIVKPDGTIFRQNLFDFKGRTDALSDHLVIVISPEDNDSYQKCIVVSDGLGLIREGNYTSNESAVNIANCTNN